MLVCTRSDESSASQRACTPLPSIGIAALRSTYWVNDSVCADAASAASTSPVSWWCRAATLSGTSGWTACTASRAVSTPTTTGSSS